MLIRQLPDTINVKKLTEQGVRLKGELRVSKLTRTLEAVQSALGDIQLELAFRKDEQGMRVAEGEASCRVNLLCQRCLKPYEHLLEVNLSLAFIYTEAQLEQLPSNYEPVLLDDDNAQLVDLIEDDLILGLPIVPLHSDERCQSLRYEEGEPVVENTPEKENPFKVLETLKQANIKKPGKDS